MNEFLAQFFTFYYVSLSLFLLAGLALLIRWLWPQKQHKVHPVEIQFRRLNQRFEKEMQRLEKLFWENESLPSAAIKIIKKQHKLDQKQEDLQRKKEQEQTIKKVKEEARKGTKGKEVYQKLSGRIYVLNFNGDIFAHGVETLREEISFLLEVANPHDEIVIKLTSPGGSVPHYGLASAQLQRIKKGGLTLTVCVDTVAASGGYLMATIADRIVASPFAYLGSIGVVMGIPNFHRVMQKHEIDYLLFTAGQYKRTVTPLSEVTEEGKQKVTETLQDIHNAFKNTILQFRKQIDIEKVSTGEFWLGVQAKEMGLVDEVMTSDEYLSGKLKDHEVIAIKTVLHKPLLERFGALGVRLLQNFGILSGNSTKVGLDTSMTGMMTQNDQDGILSLGTLPKKMISPSSIHFTQG